MINIAIVDDQDIVRQGLVQLLELNERFNVVWQAKHGEDALDKLARFEQLDVIVTDIRMPIMDGISFVQALREQGNETPVLMLTTFDEHSLFMKAIRSGANGFLLKDVSIEKLNSAIEKISTGGFIAEPELLNQQNLPKDEQFTATDFIHADELSEKEIQIIRYMAAGFSNKEIAESIFLAEGTVKNHISNLLTKLQCRDRTQAVVKALRNGLL